LQHDFCYPLRNKLVTTLVVVVDVVTCLCLICTAL
jgi:preprotein translocase subunit SecE